MGFGATFLATALGAFIGLIAGAILNVAVAKKTIRTQAVVQLEIHCLLEMIKALDVMRRYSHSFNEDFISAWNQLVHIRAQKYDFLRAFENGIDNMQELVTIRMREINPYSEMPTTPAIEARKKVYADDVIMKIDEMRKQVFLQIEN